MSELSIRRVRPVTKRQRVEAIIARRVCSLRYKPGSMIPREAALCREFGVSLITVRHALESLVQQGMLVKRQGKGTMVRGGPRRDPQRPPQITLLLCNSMGSFMTSIIHGAEQVVRSRGANLNVVIANDSAEEERRGIEQIIRQQAAGAILFAVETPGEAHPNCYHYLRLREAGVPVIFIDRYLSQLPIGYVVADDEEGTRQLTEHLIASGYQDIGYMDHAVGASSVQARRKGFVEAMLGKRLFTEVALCVGPDRLGRSDIDLAYQVMRDFLRSGKSVPRAMIGMNTYYAIGMFKALKEAGRRVPQDVALVGMGDVFEAASLEVPLTVWHVPQERIAAVASEKLLDLIEHGGDGHDIRVKIPGSLIVRQSCGSQFRGTADLRSPIAN